MEIDENSRGNDRGCYIFKRQAISAL